MTIDAPATRRDLVRQAITVLAYVVTLVVNTLANLLPINGQTTAQISDRFHVFVVPAGYVFGIWGVIYLGMLAFTVYQALPRHRDDALLRRLGYLPALTGLLNTAWILLWQYEQYVLTVPVMLALLATLVAVYVRVAGSGASGRAAVWCIRIPFSVYLGWITVATIADVAAMLSSVGFDAFGIEPQLVAAAVLLVGLAIAAAVVVTRRDVAYGLVIVWAYAGIVVKESSNPTVAVTAAAAAALVGALVLLAVAQRRDRGRTAGEAATA